MSASSPSASVAAGATRPHFKGYGLNDAEVRALERILRALEIEVPAGELMTRLEGVMSEVDVVHLVALLNFVAARQRADAVPTRKARVTRAADLSAPASSASGRLNILFVTGEFPNPVHGGGGRVADCIKGLSRDHDIYLYSGYEGRDAAAWAALRPYCRRVHVDGYDAFDGNATAIRGVIGDVGMDVVHYEWPRALTNYDPSWGRYHVFTYMEAASLRERRDLDRTPFLGSEWLRVMTQLVGMLKLELVDADQADGLIVASERDGRFYERFGCAREYYVLNHGVDFDSFRLPAAAPEPHTLTFVGNFRHRPNVDGVRWFFAEIFGRIRREVSDVTVYVVGADPTDEVRAYHDDPHVVVTGTVDDIRPYIQRASVCVAPLVTGAGLRGKLIQYAALERVCVATSIAAAGLLFEDGRDIVITDDPAAFAERVVFLLRHPAAAREMGAAASRKAIAHYASAELTQQLYSIYDRIMRRQ